MITLGVTVLKSRVFNPAFLVPHIVALLGVLGPDATATMPETMFVVVANIHATQLYPA